jgi:hypothetical protein
MTILTDNKLTLSLAAAALFGTVSVALICLPGFRVYYLEFAWITGIFSAVSALLSCYFLVESGRHRTLLMLFALAFFCFALPLLMMMLLADKT